MDPKKEKVANKVSLTLPEEILTGVKLLAKSEDRTLSNMVAVLLKEALKNRSLPLITAVEWIKRNIQIKEIRDAALAQVPRFFNLQDFIEKFHALPAWDIDNEGIIERELKDRVKERYAENNIVKPVLHKVKFQFDEEHFALEVQLYSKIE
ncbi:MAG TPA: hypothetical protein VKK79_12315 [Candidatus Lokiarchaeia archaeon]|nr:hypothetical protein [Candidatus Lokiarchaeia archaeon]